MARKETNFKQTDIGLIPHDWEAVRLGDVYDTTSGGTPSRSVREYWENGKIKWVTTGELLDGYITDTNESITELGLQNSSAKVFPIGTLLLAMYGATIGKLGILDCSAATNQACCAILSKQDSHILYLFYYLQCYRDEIVALGRGAGQPNISQEIVRNQIIPQPPIEEQKRIAEVLSHFDEHIDNLAALLEKRKQVKAATMQALLSGTTRLPGFTAPWKKRTIEQISNRYDNLRVPVAENLRVKGSTPYYGANGIQGYVQGYTHDGEYVLIAEDGANDLSNYPTQYIMGKIWVNNHAHVLQGKFGQCSTCFLSYALKTPNYKEIVVGGERAKLNAKNLMEIELFIPTKLEEQSAIASVLSNMDRGIEALEEQIEKYRQMKEGAMEELLTGKVRLI